MGSEGHIRCAVEAELERIDAWVRSAPLAGLVGHFGGDLPLTSSTGELLEWLEAFSAEHWDFRAGRERNQAVEADLGPDTVRLVADAATALGMVGSVPPTSEHYSHLLILGGLVRACMSRTCGNDGLIWPHLRP